MYKLLKEILKKAGEVMIRTADGQEFELHLHNTTFDDKNQVIQIETGQETYWIAGNQIVYFWIHRRK